MSSSVNNINSQLYTSDTSATSGLLKGDSATEKTESTINTQSLGKDDFLKLLLAQMQNQDPLNPTDNTEFVAQLAQFSSLEQMTQMNSNLESMIENNVQTTDSINRAMMVNYFGMNINAEVSDFVFDGEQPVDLNFILESGFTTGKIEIMDSEGNLVRTLSLKSMEAGNGTVTWNGVNNRGITAEAGDYSFKLTAMKCHILPYTPE